VVGVYGTVAATSINGSMALTMAAFDPATREKVMLAPHKPLMVPLDMLGWPFAVALALAAATLVLNLAAKYSAQPGSWDKLVRWTFLASLGAQALALVLLLVKVNGGPQYLASYSQSFYRAPGG